MARDKGKAKTNHTQASYPGQLVSQDTFYLGYIKGIGRIYHQVAGDCFSSFSAAQIYPDKTAKSSSDFVENHLDLDNFDYYNYRRTHQGYKLKENGYKIPGQAHLSKNLIVTLCPVKIEDENMKVLAYHSVNTS